MVNAMAKPPFPWVGSKRKLLQYIYQLIPSDITNYDPTPYLNVQLSFFERITRSKGELVLIHTPVNQKAA